MSKEIDRVEEMSLEEFEKLEGIERVNRGIVDWDEVIENFRKKKVDFKKVREYVKEKYNKLLYYSEWEGVVERRVMRGMNVKSKLMRDKRSGRIRRFWYIE